MTSTEPPSSDEVHTDPTSSPRQEVRSPCDDDTLARPVAEKTLQPAPSIPAKPRVSPSTPQHHPLPNSLQRSQSLSRLRSRYFGPNKIPVSQAFKQTCYKCGNLGHHADECQSKERLCYNCKQPGHESSDCPNDRNTQAKQCYFCKEMGHIQSECPVYTNTQIQHRQFQGSRSRYQHQPQQHQQRMQHHHHQQQRPAPPTTQQIYYYGQLRSQMSLPDLYSQQRRQHSIQQQHLHQPQPMPQQRPPPPPQYYYHPAAPPPPPLRPYSPQPYPFRGQAVPYYGLAHRQEYIPSPPPQMHYNPNTPMMRMYPIPPPVPPQPPTLPRTPATSSPVPLAPAVADAQSLELSTSAKSDEDSVPNDDKKESL